MTEVNIRDGGSAGEERIILTITIPRKGGFTSVHTHAVGIPEEEIQDMLLRGKQALLDEITEFIACNYHKMRLQKTRSDP